VNINDGKIKRLTFCFYLFNFLCFILIQTFLYKHNDQYTDFFQIAVIISNLVFMLILSFFKNRFIAENKNLVASILMQYVFIFLMGILYTNKFEINLILIASLFISILISIIDVVIILKIKIPTKNIDYSLEFKHNREYRNFQINVIYFIAAIVVATFMAKLLNFKNLNETIISIIIILLSNIAVLACLHAFSKYTKIKYYYYILVLVFMQSVFFMMYFEYYFLLFIPFLILIPFFNKEIIIKREFLKKNNIY